jgi:hypothetical protein
MKTLLRWTFFIALALPVSAQAVLSVTYQGAAALAAALVGGGVTISNVTYTGASIAAGTFSGGVGIIGFDQGIILSSGDAAGVVGPNTTSGFSVCNGTPGDPDLSAQAGTTTQDAAVLQFDFVPTSGMLNFNYVFASEEYPEFVGSFNDGFAFFVNGVNQALVPGTSVPVSINNVNCATNSAYYINNNAPGFPGACALPYANLDTQMDGLTTVLSVHAAVTPGVTNHIKLAISDAVDCAFDTDVFIQSGSLNAFTPSPTFSITPTFTLTPTFSDSPTPSPSFSVSPTFSFSPTLTDTPTMTPTFSFSPTPSDTPTPSATFSATQTATPTTTPTITQTFTNSPTITDSPTITPTFTPDLFQGQLVIVSIFPHPVGDNATILLGVPYAGDLSLKLYNLRGEVVWTHTRACNHDDDYFTVPWDGRNPSGSPVSFGSYYLEAELAGYNHLHDKTGRWMSVVR